ncbi:GNAT family N-acetyltransferase [Tabrizicola oligotrophica]|uniref:GNAT family N-acetyltransferase n=1 Tax=Tabrizicola oligotrophica TaxID=2710650 RepID=A0A6M0QSP5_9RHOB|nr:GNAT family N-acetyltransferase [Tabrizicola oligotrophica]NEY90475.1 GNAT family N-acetyltransferase [Tabrizicola oligotrophica]
MTVTIARENPVGNDLDLLFARHTADMHADTPPESIHMMDASELDIPAVHFFVAREAGKPLAMGAFKVLADPAHAEIKSMHVLHEARGRGLSKAMLSHVEATARAAGVTRLSLETGVQPTFIAARALYERAGYAVCGPFEGYWDDPNSLFMTKSLV